MARAKPVKVLFVVTEDWYFVSHRLALASAAQRAGYEVAVATREGKYAAAICASGIRLIPFQLARRAGSALSEIISLWRLYRRERPDLVHHVAMKPVLYGAFAARLAGVPAQLNAVTGLGWLFTSSKGIAAGVVRAGVVRLLAIVLGRPRSLTVVQNPDDLAMLEHAGVPARRLRLIRGAGVDVEAFRPTGGLPSGPVCIVLAARMLWDKGVGEFVQAAHLLHAKGVRARFVLVGDPDPANPASVPESTLRAWHGARGVEWWSRHEDMPAVLRQAQIACLPSYREGLPKSLLEAAACALPIVTTDTPGCRELVRDGENGLLVPVKNPTALADALEKLISDEGLRRRMGERSRQVAVKEFSQERVIEATLSVYKELVAEATGQWLAACDDQDRNDGRSGIR